MCWGDPQRDTEDIFLEPMEAMSPLQMTVSYAHV